MYQLNLCKRLNYKESIDMLFENVIVAKHSTSVLLVDTVETFYLKKQLPQEDEALVDVLSSYNGYKIIFSLHADLDIENVFDLEFTIKAEKDYIHENLYEILYYTTYNVRNSQFKITHEYECGFLLCSEQEFEEKSVVTCEEVSLLTSRIPETAMSSQFPHGIFVRW